MLSSGKKLSFDLVTSIVVYLHDRIMERVCCQTLRSSAIPLLDQTFTRTDFSRRAFWFSAPSVWNSLPQAVLITDSVYFQSRFKTFLLFQALTETVIQPAASTSEVTTIWCCINLIIIIRSTSKSRPNNIRGGKMSVRPSVRPQKVSSIWMKFGI